MWGLSLIAETASARAIAPDDIADAAQLGEMNEDTPDILGAAFTQALQEKGIQEGQ